MWEFIFKVKMDPGSYFCRRSLQNIQKQNLPAYDKTLLQYCIMLTSSLFALNTNSLKESHLGSLSLYIILVTILFETTQYNQLTMSSVYNKSGTCGAV